MTSCPFLELPQELRDLIFEYAITEHDQGRKDETRLFDYRTRRLPVSNDRWNWNVHYDNQAPVSTYLSLMLCNSQLRYELREFVQNMQIDQQSSSKITLLMAYPSVTPAWSYIPGPPENISALEILVKVDHMYHPAYIYQGSLTPIIVVSLKY